MKVRTYVADWLGVLLMSEAKLVTQLPSMNDHLCSDLFQFMVLCSVACSYVFCMDLVWVSVSVVLCYVVCLGVCFVHQPKLLQFAL